MEDQFKLMDHKMEVYNQIKDLQKKKVEDTLIQVMQ